MTSAAVELLMLLDPFRGDTEVVAVKIELEMVLFPPLDIKPVV